MRTSLVGIFVACMLLLGSIGPVRAGALAWDRETIVAEVEPSAKQLKTEFRFRNAGQHPVTITSIEPGCRCTVADMDKRTYAPGESGVLPVTFTFGDQRGIQEKMVFVTTDEGSPPMHLTLRVNVAEFAALDSEWLVWKVGEDSAEKAIECRAMTDKPLTVVAATASTRDFAARIVTVETGRVYRIFVKPAQTTERRSATVAIQALLADAGERTYKAFAAVR